MSIINKYTLKFRYTNLEEEYIQQKTSKIKIPIFTIGLLSIFVMASNKFILELIREEYNRIYVLIACQLFTLACYILSKLKYQRIDIQLIILCILLYLYEKIFNSDISRNGLQLFLGNSANCLMILMLTLEFLDSIFIIVGISLIRTIDTIVTDDQKIYALYIAHILSTAFLCFFSYKINLLSRTNYLLTQQDYMWERIFPKVIDKPYLIFQFNEDKLEFIYKSSNKLQFQCENSLELKQFLRDWSFQSLSLERLLFQNFKNAQLQEFSSKEIEICNSTNNKSIIKYTIFKSISSSVILSFQEKIIEKTYHDQVIKKLYSIQQDLQLNLLKFMFNKLKIALKRNSKAKLLALEYSCFLQILNHKIKYYKIQIRQFNVKDFKDLIELFPNIKLQISQKQNLNQNPKFITLYLKRLLLDIFQNSFKSTIIQITIDEKMIISYQGKSINFHRSEILNEIWNTTIENCSLIGNFITFFLYNEPNLKF